MNLLILILCIVLILLVGICAGYSYHWFSKREEDFARLEDSVTELKAQLARKEHTCSTSAGILDAMAVLIDAKMQMGDIQLRLDQASGILGKTHESPHAYPTDRPAGMRPGKGK